MGLMSTDAIIQVARTIINDAKDQRAWMLTENEYEQLLSYNAQLAQYATTQQRTTYLGLLQMGRFSTTDGTPAHGIFNTLLQDWQVCCALAIQSNVSLTSSVGLAA